MYSRMQALSQAKRFRTCPPPRIKSDPGHLSRYQKHCAICPYCTGEDDTAGQWENLAQEIQAVLDTASDKSAVAPARSGQIRPIRSHLARWHENFFYHPPWVLILDVTRHVSDEVLVAQLYMDSMMAAPGDLILPEHQIRIPGLFVECWNTYTLKEGFLGPVVDEVGVKILDTVQELAGADGSHPDWAPFPMPLRAHDPRRYFRELEVEVASVFSSLAVEQLLADADISMAYTGPEEAVSELKRTQASVLWNTRPATMAEVFALARHPPDDYAKAASVTFGDLLQANLVCVSRGKVTSMVPLTAEILLQQATAEQGLSVGGRFVNPPDFSPSSELIVLWCFDAGGCLHATQMTWNAETASFLAIFDFHIAQSGRMAIAVVARCDDS